MGRKKRNSFLPTSGSKVDSRPPSLPPQARQKKIDKLSINKEFADRYEVSKRKQLLSNAPAALLDDSVVSGSSSDEEEDEFGELLTKRLDRRVRETLEAIQKKDPRIYDQNARFFEDEEKGIKDDDISDKDRNGHTGEGESALDSDDEPVAGWDTIANAARAEVKKLTLKDYVRENLLQHGTLSDGEDESDREQSDDHEKDERGQYVAQEGADTSADGTKEDMDRAGSVEMSIRTTKNGDGEYNDSKADDGDSDDDFFRKKEKSAADVAKEEEDFEAFLQRQLKKNDRRAGEDLLLHSYLENEKPDEKERFLRDFVLNNGWLNKNASDAPRADEYEIEIDTVDPSDAGGKGEEEEEFEDKAEKFEAKYNFRFEDPDGTQIVSHGRNTFDSMRRPDDRRKKAREARRLRKQQEKLAKTEEIKRLKNLKKTEIRTRLFAIQEAAGDGVDLSGIDLEGDFDPEEFNRQMESKFGEEYYAANDEEMQELTEDGVANASDHRIEGKRSAEAPEDVREDVNRLMDEYYNLDYEDIVGGVPVRFNYKKVDPESFNMTAENILTSEDKELNRLVSMKYLAPYRSVREVRKQSWRVRDKMKTQGRSRVEEKPKGNGSFRDRYSENKEEEQFEATNLNRNTEQDEGDKKRKRKRSDGQEAKEVDEPISADVKESSNIEGPKADGVDGINVSEQDKKETSSTRKRKKRKAAKAEVGKKLSAKRCEAYGIATTL